jgi:hypothetical protein
MFPVMIDLIHIVYIGCFKKLYIHFSQLTELKTGLQMLDLKVLGSTITNVIFNF